MMGWLTAFLPSGPRRRHIADMEAKIGANLATVEQLKGQARNNIQAIQSGTRVMSTMSGMLKLVAEINSDANPE